ncbi:MAG: endonuclease/exonuclease/phosphatase family protein [Bacteroidales bacterium]|nr:endonuclease/exonuclease/phosphatase family protein [Bacteroidales bacterium]
MHIKSAFLASFALILAACSPRAVNATDTTACVNSHQSEKNPNSFRLVSYNVGAFGKYANSSEKLIADMMAEFKTDAMILNEVDYYNNRHNTDQVANLAAFLGWDYMYAKAMDWNGGQYGNAAAWSKDLKLVDKFVIALPKHTGSEDRSCAVVEFEDFVLAGTHLEVSSEEDRLAGVEIITNELKARYGKGNKPVFLCGDMNSEPSSAVIKAYLENWKQLTPNQNTIPSTGPNKCIDFFFGLKDVGSYEVLSAGVPSGINRRDLRDASDHLPVFVDVVIK